MEKSKQEFMEKFLGRKLLTYEIEFLNKVEELKKEGKKVICPIRVPKQTTIKAIEQGLERLRNSNPDNVDLNIIYDELHEIYNTRKEVK